MNIGWCAFRDVLGSLTLASHDNVFVNLK